MTANIACTVSDVPETENPPEKYWRELGVHNFVKILIIGGLFYYLFRNEISAIVQKWLTDSSWSHGFLIPAFSLYFLNQYKDYTLAI